MSSIPEAIYRRMMLISVCAFAGSIAWTGLQALGILHNRSELTAQLSQRSAKLAEAAKDSSGTSDKPKIALPKGMRVAAEFQANLQRVANASGLGVTQFQTGTLVTQYLSAYDDGDVSDSIGMVSAQATLQGSIREIFGAIDRLSQFEIPFEVASIDVIRIGVDASGTAVCTANLNLNLLTRKESH